MKLHWSPRSPFVRKVMICLHEACLVDQVTCVRSVVALMAPPNETVLADNPLGQIPTLVPDEGPPLYDSRVICEYIDGLSSRTKLFPTDSGERFWHLHWQALGDGLATVLVLLRNERLREGGGDKTLCNALETKVRACFAALNGELTQLGKSPFGIGHIAIVCALGQMNFRFRDSNWQSAYPQLATWLMEQNTRPSIAGTLIVDDGTAVPEGAMNTLEKLDFPT
ncbi:MAG: glutathione S-transferase [Sulfitobacter sp.]